ncbi:hypothetical protein H4R33_006057 [Dimargaris cristalligena]|nr:hypothetical protein H4R33_006057 [Dimargaris cristalligena]
MELFCEVRDIPNSHWATFASESLDGLAATWFCRTLSDEAQSHPNLTLMQLPIMAWSAFKQSITIQFLNKDLSLALRNQLGQLRQGNSSSNYISKFNNLVLCIPGMHTSDQLKYFLDGLHPSLRQDLLVAGVTHLTTLTEALIKALDLGNSSPFTARFSSQHNRPFHNRPLNPQPRSPVH